MNRIFMRLNESALGTSGSQVLTAAQFLNKDPNVKGFSNTEAMLSYGRSLRQEEVEQLEQFFDYVRKGARIVGSLITRRDRADRLYNHPAFLQGNSTPGTKLILEAGMKEFLHAYMRGEVSINFTLDELIDEAMKG